MFRDPVARSASRARSSELCKATEPGAAVITGDRSRTESGINRFLCVLFQGAADQGGRRRLRVRQ